MSSVKNFILQTFAVLTSYIRTVTGQLAKQTWNRLKDRWIQLHLVLPRLNPGEGDRELFRGDSFYEPPHNKTSKVACALSEDSDQPGHPPSLIAQSDQSLR